jgi:hypothetical protein
MKGYCGIEREQLVENSRIFCLKRKMTNEMDDKKPKNASLQ